MLGSISKGTRADSGDGGRRTPPSFFRFQNVCPRAPCFCRRYLLPGATCIGHRRNFDAERRLLLLWGERDWRGTCCVSRWKDPPSSRGGRNLFSAGAPAPEALKFRRVTGADDTTATAGAVGSAVWGARNAPFPERTVQKQKPQPLSRRLRRLIDPCFDQRERLVVACPV